MDAEKIYFLDFTFNPRTRTLEKKGNIIQLRKKQADVLSLLCSKYPEPVTQQDFLAGAWEGGYVTSQSIAQVIRSLRINLDDTNKSIIITIPKLGYLLAARPSYKAPVADNYPNKSVFEHNIAVDEINDERLSTGFSNPLNYNVMKEKCDSTRKSNSTSGGYKRGGVFFFRLAVIMAGLTLLFI